MVLYFYLFFLLEKNLFNELKSEYEKYDIIKFIFFIILLFLYLAFSAGTNVYKILTNGLYSPMVKTLAIYIFNPILFIYYFILGGDFLSEGERNIFYFMINIILSLIISFFGCVYNEFLVLSFCGLEHETYYEISKRANDQDNARIQTDYKLDSDSDNEEEDSKHSNSINL